MAGSPFIGVITLFPELIACIDFSFPLLAKQMVGQLQVEVFYGVVGDIIARRCSLFWPENCKLNATTPPKRDFMKNACLLRSVIVLSFALPACRKGNDAGLHIAPTSSISFSTGDSIIQYPVNLVFIQDVYNTHTTLISGQYPDSALKKGSLSLRLLGDTTGKYMGDSLLVTYVDGAGKTYYITKDSTNFVQVDKYPKSYNGVVTGSFALKVSDGSKSIGFSNGSLVALYQQ
jgi:hypothetical protein